MHIISTSEKVDEATLTDNKKIHQLPELELRSLRVPLNYYPNIKRIFKTRGIERQKTGESGEAKRERQQEEFVNDN